MSKKVVIIGAGLTGLVTAFYLKKRGIPFLILDKNPVPGGVIKTYCEDGFCFEGGPNTGVISHPEVAELFEDLGDLCKLEIADESAKKRLIWKNGKWEAIPSGLIGAIRTPLFTMKDKFRILGEPFRKPGTNPDETLAELVIRRMGRSFLDYAVDPFIKGVYAGDTEYLIPRYALPKLYRLEQEYGSFIGGSIKKKRKEKDPRMKKATREVFSVEGGLGNLINALVTACGNDTIILDQKSISIEKNGNDSFKVHYGEPGKEIILETDRVISTTGSFALPSLFPFIPQNIMANLNNLVYARVAEIAFGFKNWEGPVLDSFGGLVPSREERDVLGVLFPSAFLKNRAPKGGALLTTFMGGMAKDHLMDLPDADLLATASAEVQKMMQLKEFKPDLVKLFRYRYAIPQYGLTTGERLRAIREVEALYPGLIIAGNVRDGIGMADRIRQGVTIASEINN
ncbi:MAG: protoporphyrinogen oxidase [Bacteroidales bacterium]|nr:protoporphyrinogen oxidase [Bacteroidales bacterium]